MDAAAIEKLERLAALLEKGLLTREEFEAQKAGLLVPAAAVQAVEAPMSPVSPTPPAAEVHAAPTALAVTPVAPGTATGTSLEVMRRRARSLKSAGAVAFLGGALAFYVGTFSDGHQEMGVLGALTAVGGLALFIMGRLQE